MTKNIILNLCAASMLSLASLSCHAQTKRALLVGISDYGNVRENPNEWANISGANDVSLLNPLLTKQGFHTKTLEDKQATKNNILKELKNLSATCKKGDIVYVHFSMHGQPVEDKNGDEPDGWDEALIPVDAKMKFKKGVYEGQNHLLDDTLELYMNNIRNKIGPSGFLYVILDACHSGTGLRGDNEHIRGVNEGFSPSGKEYRPDTSREKNDYLKVRKAPNQSPVIVIEACRSYQRNKEVKDASSNVWYGSLSYYISKALKTNVIDKSSAWIEKVKSSMAADRRLRRQNIVIESTK